MPLTNRAPVNAAGQIMVTGTTPTPAWPVLGGMTYDPVTGELAVTSAVPNATDPWVGGLRFTNLGALYIVTTIPSPVFYVGGLPVSTLGQLFMSANPPVGSVGGWPIAGDGGVAGIGSGIGPVPIFWAPLLTTLVPTLAGNPAFTFTRATTAYVADNENILRQAILGESRFQGARRVRNFILGAGGANNSQDFTGGGWTKQNCTVAFGAAGPTGLNDATTVTATAGGTIQLYGATFIPLGSAGRMSWWVRRRTGTGTVQIRGVDGVTQTDITSQVDGTWRRFATPVQAASATPYIVLTLGTIGDQIDATYVQAEDVSGQSNQAPGDYVSVGVLASPWHGCGIDGVKCFATTNGNSVPGANLLKQSQTFDVSPWVQSDVTVANDATVAAPDGTFTADKFTDSATNTFHGVYQVGLGGAVGTFTFSVYLKQGTLPWAQIYGSAGTGRINVNLATGAVGFTNGIVSSSVTALPNGWFRVSVTWAATSLNSVTILGINANVDLVNPTYVGSLQTMYLWGAQVEPGLYATGYNPTTTAAVPAGNIVTEATGSLIPAATLLGYQAENAATNLCLQSQTFDVVPAPWLISNCTIGANLQTAPDGTLTADTFTDNTTNVHHLLGQHNVAYTSGTVYTASVYAKSGTLPWLQLVHYDGSYHWANFNLLTGLIGNKGAGVTASIFALPNGWYRCVVTVAATATTADGWIQIMSITTDQNVSPPPYAGTGQTMYLWGAQVETGSDPSSYVPTTTVAVTRNTDALTYPLAGNMSNTLGTFYYEPYTYAINTYGTGRFISSTTVPNDGSYSSPTSALFRDGANVTAAPDWNGPPASTHKVGFSYTGAVVAGFTNGVKKTPTGIFDGNMGFTDLTIGWSNAGNAVRVPMRNVKIFNVALTDVELIALTGP